MWRSQEFSPQATALNSVLLVLYTLSKPKVDCAIVEADAIVVVVHF